MSMDDHDDVQPGRERMSIGSNLAGYHYETDAGHYTTFFWQSASKVLHASTFLKRDPEWVPVSLSIRVARNAKKDTPIAAVNWLNGLNAAIYYLDDRNIIHERLSNDGGRTWEDGRLPASLTIATRSFSDLAATLSYDPFENRDEICLYFQNSQNLIRQLRCSREWVKGMDAGYNTLSAIGGTRIACGDFESYIHVVVQDAGRDIKEFWHHAKTDFDRTWGGSTQADYLKRAFDRNAPVGYVGDSLAKQQRFYAYENGTLTERIWHKDTHWFDPTTLPTGTGMSKIFSNFMVLHWARDMDCSSSEIHIFSVDTELGILWDYVVGTGHPVSVSMLWRVGGGEG